VIETVFGTALLATFVTKLVDLIRTMADGSDRAPKWFWIVLSMAFGIAIGLLGQVNVFTELGLGGSTRLEGWAGQVLTGLLVGGLGSGWHEVFDALSSGAKSARGNAVMAAATGMSDEEKVTRVWGASTPR